MKRKPKSSGGGANWMDTYGDMVTLLLCFFVLLYSMSTISEESWRTLVMSFNPNAAASVTENSGNKGPLADPLDPDSQGMEKGLSQQDVDAEIQSLFEALTEYVNSSSPGEEKSGISVTQGDGKVFISFNQAVFFDGDSPVLRKDAYPILEDVCAMLDKAVDAIGEVRVLGHTAQASANEPNNVRVDRTLSSNRATNVVIFVQEHCSISPARLISEGVGQWRPIASNATPESRAKNRRVEMIINGRNLEEELQGDITTYEIGT